MSIKLAQAYHMSIKLAQAYHMSTGPCLLDIYTNRVLVMNHDEILVRASLIVCAPCLLLRGQGGHACLGNTCNKKQRAYSASFLLIFTDSQISNLVTWVNELSFWLASISPQALAQAAMVEKLVAISALVA
jgi:hypothetical protein